ncbi:MAG: glycoside hydrolase family 5 protein [Lachnospiraceae bacterium]|nr:glycoside hydrolase family 5 protein [Lachnospiraceae bacterium]
MNNRMEEYLNVNMPVPTATELKEAVLKGSIKPLHYGKDFNPFSKMTAAQQISLDMGLGFNLGNTFDSVVPADSVFKGVEIETAWHNPKTTKEMIKGLKAGGFKTIRIPVSWRNHVESSFDIVDPAWMARVKEVVSWCLDEDFYVILNTHHDICPGFIYPDDENIDRAVDFMKNIWRRISEEFIDFSAEKLLYESMNEIRVFKAPFEWTPDYDNEDCVKAMKNTNRLNQIFVDTVRKSGGKNAERCLIIPGYSTSTEGVCWDGFELPDDPAYGKMFVAAHMYSPAHFAFFLKEGANLLTFDINDPASTDPIDERLTKLYDNFISKGIPVALDEFGTVDKENDPERVKCLAYTLAKATQLKINCCYWDNGVFFRYGDGMAIFDREKASFPRTEPLDAMLEGMKAF